jgi:hypothetical protein
MLEAVQNAIKTPLTRKLHGVMQMQLLLLLFGCYGYLCPTFLNSSKRNAPAVPGEPEK